MPTLQATVHQALDEAFAATLATTHTADGVALPTLFDGPTGYTYDDVILLPGYIDFPATAVSLATRVTKRYALHAPLVSSPMDTVTEAEMAIVEQSRPLGRRRRGGELGARRCATPVR